MPASLASVGLQCSSLVEKWTDPVSGIESLLLDGSGAPFQQSFYFVNSSLTNNGRYYWFYYAFPPAGNASGRTLAVADFAKETIHYYPETQFLDASPTVDLASGEVYWCNQLEIWKRGPEPENIPVLINRFPQEIAKGRYVACLATHLTFSSDRKALNIDAQIGAEWYIGHAPLDGSPVVIWKKFDRMFHHTQFSPTDPDLQLICQDYSVNPVTGVKGGIDHRLWLLRQGGQPETIYPGGGSNMQGHEWWSTDGNRVWYCHYHKGVEYLDIHERKPVLVWPSETVSHAHVDATETYLVADYLPPEKPSERRVTFFNRATGKEVNLVSHLPHPPKLEEKYHVHPHPQFCYNDRYICYTTTVRGRVDVAFTPVDSLIAATQC
ncbi:MAG: hypothetical protein ACFUZC_14630 [Chthoniobacteraceae bacterium]